MDPAILNAISLESTSWYDPSTSSRSEEHTSELQSRLHLVCRLLLAKKTAIQTSRPLRSAIPYLTTNLVPSPTIALPKVTLDYQATLRDEVSATATTTVPPRQLPLTT